MAVDWTSIHPAGNYHMTHDWPESLAIELATINGLLLYIAYAIHRGEYPIPI